MQKYDLHSHSYYSDGTLSPQELVERAAERGLERIALTDHDSVSGLEAAENHIKQKGLALDLIHGVEISAGTEFGEIHIVGINIDKDNEALESKLEEQRKARWDRAKKISDKLIKCRVEGVYELLENSVHQVVTRTHIARAIKELGYVSDLQQAFKKYIGKKGRAKVSQAWIPMDEAIELIRNAGGHAILAHPTRYPVSNRKLAYLIESFSEEGGEGIEVSYPSINKDKSQWLEIHREKNDLYASGGSDFHYPDLKWTDLGRFPYIDDKVPHVLSLMN